MKRKARLGKGKSKVLIIRIPVEWWEALQVMELRGNPPPRDVIREALEIYLERAKQI